MTRLITVLALMSVFVASTMPELPAQASAATSKPVSAAKKAKKHKVVTKAPIQPPSPAPPDPRLEWHGGPKMDM